MREVVIQVHCDLCHKVFVPEDAREIVWSWDGTEYVVDACATCATPESAHARKLGTVMVASRRTARAKQPRGPYKVKSSDAKRQKRSFTPGAWADRFLNHKGEYCCPLDDCDWSTATSPVGLGLHTAKSHGVTITKWAAENPE